MGEFPSNLINQSDYPLVIPVNALSILGLIKHSPMCIAFDITKSKVMTNIISLKQPINTPPSDSSINKIWYINLKTAKL